MMRKPKAAQRLRRGIPLLPSLFTTGNLFCGYYSVIATLQGEYAPAALAIGIACVIDGLDGRIARMTNSESAFGEAFDSLADVLTFGMAPAALTFSWALTGLERIGWMTAFFFLACSATRLARFNVQAGGHDRRYFVGLPVPPAAGRRVRGTRQCPGNEVACPALLCSIRSLDLPLVPLRHTGDRRPGRGFMRRLTLPAAKIP